MPPAPPCPTAEVNTYRLAETPVLIGLLEHLPGDTPYSTHLALEAARSRLVHRAVDAALAALRHTADSTTTGMPGGTDCADQAAAEGRAPEPAPARRATALAPREPRVVTVHALQRRAFPIGGLIDVVM